MFDLDHLQEIGHALARNKTRTALTAFGVFWGIFLLIVMLGSGTGLHNGAARGFGGAATNTFFLWTQRTSKAWSGLPAGRRHELSNDDVRAIRDEVKLADVVAPRSQLGGFRGGNNVSRGTRAGGFEVMGDYPEVRVMQSLLIDRGRFLDPLDIAERRKVAVIGSRVVELLFDKSEDPIGDSIRINGVYFRVVGTFRSIQSGDDAERDTQTIYLPFTTFQSAFNQGDRVGWLAVTSVPGVAASVARDEVVKVLKRRHRVAPDDERAFGSYDLEADYKKVVGLFAGISALVWIVGIGTLTAGVIGVSNIMLVVVKERTREIGIRRAIGATPWTITSQIVLESVLLTGLAGYLGLVSGMATMELASSLIPSTSFFHRPEVSVGSALVALAVLIVAGILAGLLPADRALRVRPVEALRSE